MWWNRRSKRNVMTKEQLERVLQYCQCLNELDDLEGRLPLSGQYPCKMLIYSIRARLTSMQDKERNSNVKRIGAEFSRN